MHTVVFRKHVDQNKNGCTRRLDLTSQKFQLIIREFATFNIFTA